MNLRIALSIAVIFFFADFSYAAIKFTSTRNGNIETVTAQDGNDVLYKLIYSYEGDKIVKGEHWKFLKPKEKKELEKEKDKPKTNVLAGTAMAKKFDDMLKDKKVIDDFDPGLGRIEGDYILDSAQKVSYNANGLPSMNMKRGYTQIPVLGTFLLKTNLEYIYDAKNRLKEIKENNLNTDTLLLLLGLFNTTEIQRDAHGRPTKVKKTIGAAPPVIEETTYDYHDATNPNMKQTKYGKVGLKGTEIKKTETITILYGKKVPWEGRTKYKFDMGKTIEGIVVYDEIEKKNKIDGSNFMKMNYIKKGLFLKGLYDLYKLEKQGPRWRMGELPDVPEPFLIYEDYAWFN